MALNTPKITEIEENLDKVKNSKKQILWGIVTFFIYLHISAGYGAYLLFTEAKWLTWIWGYILILISTQGSGAGAHRLWSHRAYKAKLPLRILLALYQTVTFQKDIYNWVRDHRGHHKFTDTIHDPHNASRGFFYSHMGWLMYKKPYEVTSRGKTVDMSDLDEDPVVMFQRKYYFILSPIFAIALPSIIPWYFWNESFNVSWHVSNMLRYFLTLHGTCLVNSAAHIWGNKPYDKNISPGHIKIVSYLTNGEGFHNYHHTFPWDYKAAEFGTYDGNLTTAFIDFMAMVGWAYDLKTVPLDLVAQRAGKTGDGTRFKKDNLWGWGDKTMGQNYIEMTTINYASKSDKTVA